MSVTVASESIAPVSAGGSESTTTSTSPAPTYQRKEQHGHLHPVLHGVAGIAAAVMSTTATYPLDLIKTRFQVQGSGLTPAKRAALPVYTGTVNAFVTIARTEGIGALYNGMQPAVIGSASAWGLYFLLYTTNKRLLTTTLQTEGLQWYHYTAASTSAGLLTCIATHPFFLVKTRMCLQTSTSPIRYTGLIDGLSHILRHQGIRGVYAGLIPNIMGVPHGAIQFTMYEEINHLARRHGVPESSLTHLAVGALSKVFASTATYPAQVLRTRIQDAHTDYDRKSNEGSGNGRANRSPMTQLRVVVSQTIRAEGIRGFYRGLVPNTLRVVPGSAVTFLGYEKVKRLLLCYMDNDKQ